MGFNKIVQTVHPELMSIMPLGQARTFDETKRDILSLFSLFKPVAGNRMDVVEFTSFVKSKVRSRYTAVARAAIPAALSVAGFDAGRKAYEPVHPCLLFLLGSNRGRNNLW